MLEVKIKAGKYGQAIALLLQLGAGFQTRFERTLIVNAEQRHILQEEGVVEAKSTPNKTRDNRAGVT